MPVSITVANGQTTVRSKAEISIRGNSTANYPKKPYRIELHDENGDDRKEPLLGMPKESDWILLASYVDKTMIRDVLAYELWRRMGHYAPRARYVELYFETNSSASASNAILATSIQPTTDNDQLTNSYQGIYILVEKIKRGKERLNIAKLTPGDNEEPTITGGYIFRRDKTNSPNDRVFRTGKGLQLLFEEPKGRDITPAQEQYLTNYINDFEAALFDEHFTEPEHGYRKYVDIDSFVDYHWMQELGKNVDAYWWSEFYYKDRGGKLKIGPIWDFDLAFGNAQLNFGYLTDNWRWSVSAPSHYRWFKRMFDDPDFVQRFIDRWSELRTNVFATSNVLAIVDGFAAQLQEAQKRNYERWPTLGKRVDPAYHAFGSWELEVNWLKEWLKGRLEWIDSQDFPKPAMAVDEVGHRSEGGSQRSEVGSRSSDEAEDSTEGSKGSKDSDGKDRPPSHVSGYNQVAGNKKSIRMACLVGKIHYTLDGSDPRLPGGAISPNAAQYKEAIPVTPGMKLFARVRSDYELWSAPVTYAEPEQKETKKTKE